MTFDEWFWRTPAYTARDYEPCKAAWLASREQLVGTVSPTGLTLDGHEIVRLTPVQPDVYQMEKPR
jgi:hypothetical protein